MRARHDEQSGASGSSWISQPGTTANLLVEQIDEPAQDAALGLSAQSEQNEVVLRENRVDELRDDGVVVADDAGEQRFAGLQLAHEVVADFLFDGTRVQTRLPEFAQCVDGDGHRPIL